jgi:hypothetical protein
MTFDSIKKFRLNKNGRLYFTKERRMNSMSTRISQGFPFSTAPILSNLQKQTVCERKKSNETLPGSRIGLHYYPDTLHFCETDLQNWLVPIKKLGVSWLFLDADATRAIPEPFIQGLLDAGVQPVLNFRTPIDAQSSNRETFSLFEIYAKWGVRHVVLFDRPNSRSVWPSASWAQQDLVERFLDRFVPLADGARQAGLLPIFSPLEPGGGYWDTAFLRTALATLLRRKQDALLSCMSLSAYAWTHSHSLIWGVNGPESWPSTHPYHTPADSQDQKGFRIFDWYRAITQMVLGEPLPIFLLQAGAPFDMRSGPVGDEEALSRNFANIARQLNGEPAFETAEPEEILAPIPDEVTAAFFWIPGAPEQATFQKVSKGLRDWAAQADIKPGSHSTSTRITHPISHYLLLPTYEWGISEWHLEAIRPFIRKYRATVGYSLNEAALAARVTVIGSEAEYSEEVLQQLRQSGCRVERIIADGTTLATVFAER